MSLFSISDIGRFIVHNKSNSKTRCLNCLCSEPRMCFRENQHKVKEPFLKLHQQESLFVMVHPGKNFRELSPRTSLTEAEMFL